jgi:hypothetical protein
MKSVNNRIKILLCLIVLSLISAACQSTAPATPTSVAPTVENPTALPAAYPEPYPLLPNLDPYLPPVLPYPEAFPVQATSAVPEGAGLYPGVQDGAEVYWIQAVSMLMNDEVKEVMQTHDLKVYLTLKDGRTLLSYEPKIDEIMNVIKTCGVPCSKILVATE